MSIIKALGRPLSQWLASNPNTLFNLQSFWLEFGQRALDLSQADWVIRRPEWLRQKPRPKAVLLEPARAQPASIEVAQRLIAGSRSRHEALGPNIPLDSIWGQLRIAHYRELCAKVEEGDPKSLQMFLGSLFRHKTVNGYTYGDTFDRWPHRWNYLPVQIELSVVQLAEALGILRAECHEQGATAFWRKLMSEAELITRLESFFGFRIEQPRAGDPRGIMFGERFLTRETCSHLHSAYKISLLIDRGGIGDDIRLVEIGGGFGGTCYWLHKVLGSRLKQYAIVDLPEVGLVQSFFLGSTLGERLHLPGEVAAHEQKSLFLVPYTELDATPFQPNVYLNQDSMPEMPADEVHRYLRWMLDHSPGIFLSFNQEAYAFSGNELQNCVPHIVAEFPKFRRVSRETSWDRRGYVEELYRY
jgi:putative sugar O-methyltransferase